MKDPDNACVVEIDSSGSEDFLVKGSSFNEVESKIESENCVWNEAKVDCKDLFKPQPKSESYTIVIMMLSIAVMAVVAVSVIIVKIPM